MVVDIANGSSRVLYRVSHRLIQKVWSLKDTLYPGRPKIPGIVMFTENISGWVENILKPLVYKNT